MDAKGIVDAALELGYHSCGIIKVGEVADYADKLDERASRTPESAGKISELYHLAHPQQTYPWAKSIVVCVRRYGKYHIPQHLEGLIAKFYLTDGRTDEHSQEYQASIAFEHYLNSIGLRTQTERKFGITALRWAAQKAGLGIIRRNNFFYADCGSWVHLEAWLIDQDMVVKHECDLTPCPPKCSRCIDACPTKSLWEPYTMSRATCVSCLTTWDGDDLIHEPNNHRMDSWIFGCDACQDICPHNIGKWESTEEFPGLEALSDLIGLDKIPVMDYETLQNVMLPKFWYIPKDRIWKWKINVLNAIRNTDEAKYENTIRFACHDQYEQVRKMAYWVLESTKVNGSATR